MAAFCQASAVGACVQSANGVVALSASRSALVCPQHVPLRSSNAGRFTAAGSQAAAGTKRGVVRCEAAVYDPPSVAETKAKFLAAYPRPVPSIYNNVIQEILVQQHLTRYNRTYRYDPVFALGFVTVFDQLLDGFPSPADREKIFKAYIEALNEDPAKYRSDALQLEEWAGGLPSVDALVDFAKGDGLVEGELKTIADRAKAGAFHYSRFFAVGLFRLLQRANASDPANLQKLCEVLSINQSSVNRDLDVYRGLLAKLTQAKELLQEFLRREKAKKEEREREKAEGKKDTAEAKKD